MEQIMFKLNPLFQKKIFEKLINMFGNSFRAGEILGLPASSIRAYKNIYFKTVQKELIEKLISLEITKIQELHENVLEIKNKKEIIEGCLKIGRKKRKDYFEEIRKNMPSLNEIISNGKLDFSKWFHKYLPLVNSNLRSLRFKEEEDYFILNYNNFTKEGFKDFEIKIPSKFNLGDDFVYFFGLWCGDRSGGKRFGIFNQEENILDFSERFLKSIFQKPKRFLYIKQNEIVPEIPYYKKIIIDRPGKGWAISTHVTNGILSSFFYYLLENIEDLLKHLDLRIFFAGLFDAEGNVSFYNKSFRWACKNKGLIKTYSKFLGELDLYKNYDGGCLISYNKKAFYDNIFPHLKHKKKRNHSLFLCKGEGEIPSDLKNVLNYIKKNTFSTQKEIAKALKKSKVYSELGLLREFGFILAEDYPLRFKLNNENKI